MRRAVRQPTCFSSREPDIQVMHTSNPVLISFIHTSQVILANPDHKSQFSSSTNKSICFLQLETFPSVFLAFFSPKTSLFFTFQTQPRPRLHLPAAFSQADTCSSRKAVACPALALTSYLGPLAISQTLNQGQFGGI